MIKKLFTVIIFLGYSAFFCSVHAQGTKESMFGNAKAEALVKEGNVLWSYQKADEALEKYRQASVADPKASAPWSSQAAIFFTAAKLTKPEFVEEYRARSKALAQKALQLNAEDPVALEVLRGLVAPSPQEQLTSNQEAARLFSEAEDLFQRHDFKAAVVKYEAAAAQDPKFARAVLYAGDAYFQLQNFDQAEKLYRKSLDIDPRNFQGWRFLAHAQDKLGRPPEVIKLSLIKSIEIQPNYMPAWDWYAQVSANSGQVLKPISVKRYADLKPVEKDGKKSFGVEIDASIKDATEENGGAAWFLYALAKVPLMATQEATAGANLNGEEKALLSPFRLEKAAWTQVFSSKEFVKKINQPTLGLLQQAAQNQELDAAIFILFFEEAYRPDFEAWKKENPTGLQKFIEKYGVRPSIAKK
ncbi:tetratricopeptide repeat protein [Undibacterium sp. LX40W]|uniref:Tetratricopeptide repeat protein n=1 Tax=Undibacterium nitidum TaxID=2762298 RepID=A0A923KUD8_9BURK|nr:MULTISPECIES: tetratricopeptide repeat protein [Undibacterium]MBC3883186.1 tetratricopeptide repeat protein [Undibacterium nitidum]MBC3893468.1 tetratricopeptide repeat protein [Undibacterium sp. LX40W]